MSYVVSVSAPTPAWVCWDHNTNIPRFTFCRPQGMSRADAERLKDRADVCCGGTLRIVRVD